MVYLQIIKMLCEKRCHKAPVALFGGGFAAQQACAAQFLSGDQLMGLTPLQQLQKPLFIFFPFNFLFLIAIQDLFGGGQKRFVPVIAITNGLQKIGKVIPFGKTGQLRNIVEPDIDKPFHTRI